MNNKIDNKNVNTHKFKIKLIILLLLLVLMIGITFAWYEFTDLTNHVVIDKVDFILDSTENLDKQLTPEGFDWFQSQTDHYTFVYKFTDILIEGYTINVDYTFINISPPATLDIYMEYTVVSYLINVVNDNTYITINVRLTDPENAGIYNKLKHSTADIVFTLSLGIA